MIDQPFIRSITLRNFLSYGDESREVPLRSLNVMIGPNASGKSNLVEAFGVLRAATGNLSAPFKDTGISEWLWKGSSLQRGTRIAELEAIVSQPDIDMGLRYHLALTEAARRTELADEFIENEQPYLGHEKDGPFFHYRYQNGHPIIGVQSAEDEEPSLPSMEQAREQPKKRKQLPLRRDELRPDQSVLSQRNDPAFYPEISYLANQFAAISIYRLWDTGPASPIRTPSKTDDLKSRLADDAGNLALALNNLLKHSENRRRILRQLQSFYDRAEDFDFDIYANTVQLGIREKGAVTPIPASRLSDGTLRYLGLLAVLCDPSPPPVVCIEEPELGMHPDVIPVIADMLLEASERTQLIVTTHSDLLVSRLRDTPEAILVCDWTEQGTEFRRLTKEDVASWPDDISLGDIWLKGGFGGTRW